ncbi:RNA polymerase sigma factor RpoD/SigA [Nannocystis pusilla]|uniref:RNA polymerase sigma factor RpoD/SigA n=1 Tax=Nannocystis pusilla TaxID=889268 RepID=A0A9X3F093_9BACT|nr:RNA polymerase sigma factor RpoD/SigA [Nannocystis pusilla]MCY1013622.1 RNA polymerase sigma factor RpoD/SigA [Nannocystis pusilla]
MIGGRADLERRRYDEPRPSPTRNSFGDEWPAAAGLAEARRRLSHQTGDFFARSLRRARPMHGLPMPSLARRRSCTSAQDEPGSAAPSTHDRGTSRHSQIWHGNCSDRRPMRPAPTASSASSPAVAGVPPSTRTAERVGSSPYSPLSAYFRELSQLPALSRDEELDAATRIAALRANFWRTLFGHAPFVAPLCEFLVDALSDDDRPNRRDELARVARAFDHTLPEGATFERIRDELGEVLVEVDCAVIDRLVAGLAVVERCGGSERVGLRRLPTQEPIFWRFAAEVRGSHRALQVAKNAFVRANLRLVIAIARQYDRGLLPLQDLIQEGNLGLLRAVDRFDHRRGCRFATYAAWWIRHAIHAAVYDKSRDVRLPAHVRMAQSKLRRVTREFEAQHGRAPSDAELVALTGLGGDRLERVRGARTDAPLSLDHAVSGPDGLVLHEVLMNPDDATAPERIDETIIAARVGNAFARLSSVEADILRKHLGLDDEEGGLTLQQIGRTHSLSRERIRQLRKQALVKLRAELRRQGLA